MKQQTSPSVSKRSAALSTLVALGLSCGSILHGQTIEWSSAFETDFQLSTGAPLDTSFTIELGTFFNFEPNEENYADWSENWKTFDSAVYNSLGSYGYFSATADMNSNGGSVSPQGLPNFDFQGRQAFMWVRNKDYGLPGAEWFLAEEPAWVFPTIAVGCCNTPPPLQWEINTVVAIGAPIVTTSVPEPGSALLTLASATLVLLRRRRP